jgi:hypothetical protein
VVQEGILVAGLAGVEVPLLAVPVEALFASFLVEPNTLQPLPKTPVKQLLQQQALVHGLFPQV